MSRIPPGVLCIDRVKPTAVMTSPASGNVAGPVTLAASAADNDQVASCQFNADGANAGALLTAPPFQVAGDTKTLPNGPHSFGATVWDRVGNFGIAPPVGVTVANPPAINFYSPGNGATITGTITLAANVTHYASSVTVWFYIDGTNVYGLAGGSGGYSMSYDSHYLTVGWHTFTCIAQDNLGNQSRVDTSVYCNNQPPATGFNLFGEWLKLNEDSGNYEGDRQTAFSYDLRWDWKYQWSAHGSAPGYQAIVIPGNPDPTHYQMSVQMGTNAAGRTEGGSAGNVEHIAMNLDGNEYDVWANGPTYGPYRSGPSIDVGGGDSVAFAAWCTIVGMNTNFRQGIGVYWDFRPKPGYNS